MPGRMEEGHTKEPGAELQCSEAHLLVAEAPDGGWREAERRNAKAQRGQRIHRDVVLRHFDDDLQTWQPSANVQADIQASGHRHAQLKFALCPAVTLLTLVHPIYRTDCFFQKTAVHDNLLPHFLRMSQVSPSALEVTRQVLTCCAVPAN